MENHKKGIHHITGMAGDPQQNAEFYVNTLGMRMVKKSVNQDDPGTYHLFYGNASATPGSSITFFPWPRAVKGKRYGFTVLPFEDPDGLSLELVFEENDLHPAQDSGWEGTVDEEHAIRGFWGTTLRLTREQPTAEILEDILGFSKTDSNDSGSLFATDAAIGGKVVIEKSKPESGTNGRGIIHHVAFRAEDEEELDQLRHRVSEFGLSPTQIIDRHWFKSVYYQTPGGVLFEMATEGPGYAVDEDPEHLGENLILPPWLESKREQIENRLPEIEV